MRTRSSAHAAVARRVGVITMAAAILAATLAGCAGTAGDTTATSSSTPAPATSAAATPSLTPEPTAEPTTEPPQEPQDPDAAITAACDTLNTGYDQGRDGWLAARTQAAALTAQASPAGDRYAQADSTMQAFAATTYPGASSTADEVNAYLDSYLTVVSMCADFGVTLKTE